MLYIYIFKKIYIYLYICKDRWLDFVRKSGNSQEANDKYAKDISISNGIGTLAVPVPPG